MESTTGIVKSKSLIGCGGTLVFLNGAMFGFSLTFLATGGFYPLFAFVMVSSMYHMLLGFISVTGGYDLKKHRRFVITSLVMAIVGCAIFTLPAVILTIIAWSVNVECYSDFCRNTYSSHYLPILVLSVSTAITEITLSSLNCSNLCNCCNNGFPNSGVSINPLVYAYGSQHLPVYSTQYPVQSPNLSNYPIYPPDYAIGPQIIPQQNDYRNHEDSVPILSPHVKF